MGIDPARADELFAKLNAGRVGGASPDEALAAYNELSGMGFGQGDIEEGLDALSQTSARAAAPAPEPEGPGLFERAKSAVAKVPAYFSSDAEKPELPDGEQQATAPTPAPVPPPKGEAAAPDGELREVKGGIDLPDIGALYDKFITGAKAVGRTAKGVGGVFASLSDPRVTIALEDRLAGMGEHAGKQSDPTAAIAATGDGSVRKVMDVAGKVLARKTPIGATLTALDAFGRAPVLNPKSKFAKDHPTAFSLANEMIETPRQLYVGATQLGPRETMETIEKLPELVGGEGAEDSAVARAAKWARESTLPDSLDEHNTPQTFGQRVAAGLGRGITGDLPTVILLMRALGPAGGMAAFSALKAKQEDPGVAPLRDKETTVNSEDRTLLDDIKDLPATIARNQEQIVEPVKGAAMGELMGMTAPFTRKVQASVMGGATGLDALVQGASPEQALEQGLVMGGLAAQGDSGGVKLKQGLRESAAHYGESARAAGEKVFGGGEYDPRATSMGSKLKSLMPEVPDRIADFLVDKTMPISTDPNAAAYDVREQQREARKKERAARILEERIRTSGSKENLTPDEIDSAVRTADVMETKAEAPRPVVSAGIQQHPGFVGISKGKVLFDLTKAELHPNEMQYKRTGAGGVTNRLMGIEVFSPKAAGSPPPVLWYNSPNRKDGVVGDGSVWVVDGHHRGERAHAMGAHDPVEVEILDGAEYTMAEARTYGALSNINLGNGTPTDAAKLFRETGMTVEDLKRQGLSVTDEKIIKPAIGLSNLNDALFRRVTLGEMTEGVGATIGHQLPDHDAQNALIHLMNQRGKGRTKVSAEWVEEAIRTIQNSPMGQARQSGQMMLGQTGDAFDPKAWGVGAESYALERTNLSTKILEELREDASTYSAMGKDRIAKRAAELGTPIDQVEAAERGRIGALIEGSYKKLSSYAGPLSDLLNEGARRIRGGEKIAAVQRDIIDAVRKQVFAEAEGRAPGDATSIAGEDIPADTATGDMFGGGASDEPVVPPDDKTASMFGTDADPAADAQPTGDDGAIPPDAPPAVPTWEEPAGQKGWQTWTKERRALSDEDLIAEIERVRAFGGDNPKKGAGRGVKVLEKIASDRGLDVDRMIGDKTRDESGMTGYSDEPSDPLAGIDLSEDEIDAHYSRAGTLSDDALKKEVDGYRRGTALGDKLSAKLLPIYEEHLRIRQEDRDRHGEDAWKDSVEPPVQPAWESPEAEAKFAAAMDRWGDGELRTQAAKLAAIPDVNRPELLARKNAIEAELEKRGLRKPAAPPPADAITPGSEATPSERLRARARKATPEALEKAIVRDERVAEKMPADSKKRAALLARALIFREVLGEKQGTVDPVVAGHSKAIGRRARMMEQARAMSTQELVDWIARPDTHEEWRPVYEEVLSERASGGELPPQPSVDKKQRSTTEKGGKKKKRKSTDPEHMGRIGGIDPEDEPVGPSAYAKEGVVEQEDNGPGGIKAAPGLDREVETPTGIPDDLPPRTAPPEASEVPVGRVGIRSIFGLRRPTNQAGVDELVRRADIVRALAEKLKVPIRQGRINMRRALGIYKIRPEVIRAQIMKDIATVAHEIGHHIDKRVFSNAPSGPMGGPPWNRQPENFGTPVTRRMGGIRPRTFDAFAHELHPLATPGMPGPEGFAEFVSMYVTHPVDAARRAPSFYRFFEQNVQRRAPEVMEALLDARRDYERYLNQPATQRVLSNISIGEYHDKPAGQRGWYHNWVEDIAPLKEFRDAVAGPNMRDWKFKENEWSQLDANEDPYVLTRLLAGWVGKADAFIGKGRKGALDFATLQRVHRPLEEALEGVRDINDLRAYMIARRTIEVGSRPMGRRIETGITMAEARATVQEVERRDPHIRRAFTEIREISDAALKYLSDSGMISRETYQRILNANHDFVPLHRLMEDDVEAGFQRRSRATNEKEVVDLKNPIYRLKGSHRDIVDPLESTVKNIYTYVYLAERNKVGQSLVELARRTHGSGFGVEEVPHDMVPAAMLRPEELPDLVMREFKTALQALNDPSGHVTPEMIDRARTAMEQHGFTMTEIAQMQADIQNAQQGGQRGKIIKDAVDEVRRNLEIATPTGLTPVFRPGLDKKGEPIVAVRFEPSARNPSGEVFIRLSPELFQVVKGLDAETAGTLTKMLAPLARGLRAGVILSPEFAIPNLIRDQMTALMQSRNGFVPILDTIRGLSHLLRNTELARDFYISGGAMAELTAMDRKYLQHSVQESISASGGQLSRQDMNGMNPLDRWRARLMNLGNRVGVSPKGTFYLSHPIEALRLLTEYSENATRIGEYAKGIRNAQRAGVHSRREQMARAGYSAREVTIDFARAGAKARQINKIIAFWNVAVQGPDRLLAAAKRDPVGFNIKALAGITLPSAILWAMNQGDPRVDELDERTKDLHWVVPMGTVTRDQWKAMSAKEKAQYNIEHPIFIIPKPYEAGLIFGSLAERTLDWMYKKDSQAVDKWIESVWESVVPGIMPTAVGPIYEAASNHSGFRGSSLVPRSLEDVEAFEQKTNYTSDLAVQIARVSNMVPMGEFMGKTLGLQSPIKIENYIRGYLGGSGVIAMNLADAMISSQNTVIEPEKVLADRFLIKRFVRRYPSAANKEIETFYDEAAKSTEAEATQQLYVKRGDAEKLKELYARRGDDLALVDMHAAAAKNLSMMRAVADGIRRDDRRGMTPREKRVAIDEITFRMIDMARQSNEASAEFRRVQERKRQGLAPEEAPPEPPEQEAKPVPPPPPPPKRKPYDPPDVSDALKRGELKPNEMADFADHHRKQAQGGR